MNETIETLIKHANRVTGTFQLNPYPTNYAGKVGTALLTKKGSIFTGVSINLACALGNCAEQSAINAMLKERETEIQLIVSIYEGKGVISPCGRCRELMMQIDTRNEDTMVVINNEGATELLSKLLPNGWNNKE